MRARARVKLSLRRKILYIVCTSKTRSLTVKPRIPRASDINITRRFFRRGFPPPSPSPSPSLLPLHFPNLNLHFGEVSLSVINNIISGSIKNLFTLAPKSHQIDGPSLSEIKGTRRFYIYVYIYVAKLLHAHFFFFTLLRSD